MNHKILCVDDDAGVLDGIQRSLRKQFMIDTALGGNQALEMIEKQGPYAVIVADMRMPGMDGIQFLSKVQERVPDTVRIMLTGNVDQQTAIQAVNQGHVFQFLAKPCPLDLIEMALRSGIKQYDLVRAERELLEHTLNGSIKVLVEILSVVEPQAFGRSQQLREYMRTYLQPQITPDWRLELAAILSPIGYVTIPSAVAAKIRVGEPLTDAESAVVMRMPELSSKLLSNIPRLETVAEIILYQDKHYDGSGFPEDTRACDHIPLGARILKVLNDLLDLEAKGMGTAKALQQMQKRSGWYDPLVLEAAFARFGVRSGEPIPVHKIGHAIPATDLRAGHVLFSNIYTVDGILIVTAGTKISLLLLERIRNFAKLCGLKEPLYVQGY